MNNSPQTDTLETEFKPLWVLAQEGNDAAYAKALALISKRLRRFFQARLQGLPDEVEDLVQETMIAIHNKRGTYDPNYPVSAWVFAIGRHKMIDLLRRRGRTSSLNDSIDDLDESNFAEDDSEYFAKRDLRQLLTKLPDNQRQAIEMSKLQGLSLVEVSNQTGHSVAALKVQIHRGLKKLSGLIRTAS